MSDSFHPLRDWLGIDSPPEQPTYYQLLKIDPEQGDVEQIKIAADRALAQVRSHRPGAHAKQWAQLLDELTAAKDCLTDPEKRSQYDAQLATGTAPTSSADTSPSPTATATEDFLPPSQPSTPSKQESAPEETGSTPASATPAPTTTPAPQPTETSATIAAPPVSPGANYFAGPGIVAPAHLQATGLATTDPMQPYAPQAFNMAMPTALSQPAIANAPVNAGLDVPAANLAEMLPSESQSVTKVAVNRKQQAFDRRIVVVVGLLLIGLIGGVITMAPKNSNDENQVASTEDDNDDSPNLKTDITSPSESNSKPKQPPRDTMKPVEPKPATPKPEPKPTEPKPKPEPKPTEPKPEPEPTKPKPEPEPKPPTPLSAAELASLKMSLTNARQALFDRDFKRSADELKKADMLVRFPAQLAALERVQQLKLYAEAFQMQLRQAIAGLDGGAEIKISNSTVLAVVEVKKDSIVLRVAGTNRTYLIDEIRPGIAVAIIKQSYDLNEASTWAMLGAYIATLRTADDEDLAKAAEYWQDAINRGAKLAKLPEILKDDYAQLKADQ